ncbi:hypothetical protein GCM10010991_33090 [Gemmobacter aquaticus]|uniref:Uncharacterized protein n=1 Tax=Gemmobacter aquaticus TaxID=490185 RepID=A0A917YM13_9RHOB|nr:hypothetical protein [Gemmobacter aquaticus]GGO37447.1 hypothetical protein GCM10010991_33090 [Gemmobacter aquaticus]
MSRLSVAFLASAAVVVLLLGSIQVQLAKAATVRNGTVTEAAPDGATAAEVHTGH